MHRASYFGSSLAGVALLFSASSVLAQEQPGQPPGPSPPGQGQQGRGEGVRVGQPVPDLSLPDLDGRLHTLQEHLQRGEVVVLEWVDPATLHAGRHHQEDQPFHQTYTRFRTQRNVIFIAVCSFGTSQDAPLDHAEHGASGHSGQPPQGQPQRSSVMSSEQAVQLCREAKQRHGIEYPILLDEGGRAVERFGLAHVPHVFIIDKTGTLAFSAPAEEPMVHGQTNGTNDFAVALQQVINGEPVTVPQGTLPAGARRQQSGKWTCPMHPQVASDAAGACPTCHMALEQRKTPTWTCPMHPQVVADAAGACPTCHMALEQRKTPN